MGALLCDICGGELEMQVGGFAVCGSCGIKYNKDSLQEKVQNIKGIVTVQGAVETVKGSAELERLLKNAKKFIELQEFKKAYELLDEIITNFSNDYRGWLLMFELLINQSKTYIKFGNGMAYTSAEIDIADIEKCSEYATSLCPECEIVMVNGRIEKGYNELIDKISTGSRYIDPNTMKKYVKKENVNHYLQDVITKGIALSNDIKKYCERYKDISHINIKKFSKERFDTLTAIRNSYCVIGRTVYWDSSYHNTVLCHTIPKASYESIIKVVDQIISEIITSAQIESACIYCKEHYRPRIKAPLFGRGVTFQPQVGKNNKCIICGRKQPKNIAELKEN